MKEANTTTHQFYMCIIGLRLIAIYLATQIINYMPALFFLTTEQPHASTLMRVLSTIPFISNILLAVLMWFFAGKIATLIIGKHTQSDAHSASNISNPSLIFSAVGLFIFLSVFPDLVVWLGKFFMSIMPNYAAYQMPRPAWLEFLPLLLKTLLSLWLIFKNQRLIKLIDQYKN